MAASAQPVKRDQSFMAIVLNKPLPEFEANATSGLKVSNISHLGQPVVLFFYPKDNTPGCTTEAMQFRDNTRISSKPAPWFWACRVTT
jgi:peroxiredoxin Q/BCP